MVLALSVWNQEIPLLSVLEWVHKGLLRVPMDVPPVRWGREACKDFLPFLESLRKDWPLGSYLVWEQVDWEPKVPLSRDFGLLHVPEGAEHPWVLLDGHQRLARLYSLFYAQESEESSMYFDAEVQRFLYLHVKEVEPKHFPSGPPTGGAPGESPPGRSARGP